MDLLHALILGVVEGLSEFLPISSTGHLILASQLCGITSTEFVKSFEIVIQLGAILSVAVLYGRSFLTDLRKWQKVAVAFLPTAAIGFVLYKFIKKFLLGNSQVVIGSLFIGGVALIVFELFHKEKKDSPEDLGEIPFRTAFLIGVFQSLSVVPGVSRSAATIVGGMLLGLKRRTIVEFSFLLAMPTMLAASGLDLVKNGLHFSESQWTVLAAGFIASFVVAIISIKFLLAYIKNNTFIPFGIYRIVVAGIFMCLELKR